MAYFPVNINIENKKCFVIGGGTVAKRKVNMLLDFGADVTVVAEELKQDFEGCKVLKKPFEYDDIKSAFFVVASTDNKKLNSEIAQYCRENNLYVNSVTNADDCTFTLSSYIRQGDIVISVNTSGKSPALSKYLREYIEKIIPSNLSELLDNINGIRQNIYEKYGKNARHIFRKLIDYGFKNQGKLPVGDDYEDKNRD